MFYRDAQADMNPRQILVLIAMAMGFGVAWTWQSYRADAYKLEVANERISRDRAARQQAERNIATLSASQVAAQLATDRVRRDAAGAASGDVGLRDALAGAVRTAHSDLEACTRQVATLSELFSASADTARSLAVEADSWSIQAVTLQNAWPK
jgi:hypothetical protein